MELVYRTRGDFKGNHIVYDNKDEALKTHGIGVIKHVSSRDLKAGDWVEYADGRVVKVLKTSTFRNSAQYSESTMVYTCLNQFIAGSKHVLSIKSSRPPLKLDMTKVTKNRVKFVEDWLFHGYTIEESAKKNLRQYYRMFDAFRPKEYFRNHTFKMMGHFILNGEWFDELLSRSRPIRDRYMDLVGAFKKVNLDDETVANRIKKIVEGESDKEALNAIKFWHDVVDAEKNRNKRSSQDDLDSVVLPSQRQLPEKTKTPAIEVPDFEDELEKINTLSVHSINMEKIVDAHKNSKPVVQAEQVSNSQEYAKKNAG